MHSEIGSLFWCRRPREQWKGRYQGVQGSLLSVLGGWWEGISTFKQYLLLKMKFPMYVPVQVERALSAEALPEVVLVTFLFL